MTSQDQRGVVRRTREELYAEVWSTPMTRLAAGYGISDNGLAKICGRLGIPYPPRGYWAKKQAGKSVLQIPLPPLGEGVRAVVDITATLPPAEPRELPPEVKEEVEKLRSAASKIQVPERLNRPHPIIAQRIEEREQRRREARRDKSQFGILTDPGEFTPADRRGQRILDTLFKTLEQNGAQVSQNDRREFVAARDGEAITFVLRERNKQVRRPLTAREQSWQFPGDKDWKQELQPTGLLTFEFKTYVPEGLRRPWSESAKMPMEDLLSEIVPAFVAAWPLLAQRTRQRLEDEERRRVEAQRLYEEKQRRKRDDNRWRRFVEFAYQQRDAELARQLIDRLRTKAAADNTVVGGQELVAWLRWAEGRVRLADPVERGAQSIFAEIADVTEYAYRD